MKTQKKLRTSKGIIDLAQPAVTGILNVTPDSFYDGGRYTDPRDIAWQAGKMLDEGASFIDIGGVSTRPGAAEVTESEEMDRILPAIEEITRHFPEAILSIDTYRSGVAAECIQAGGHMINDISGGQFDERMFSFIAETGVPYIMMHIKGNPADMQKDPKYTDVVTEVMSFFEGRLNKLRSLGVTDNVVIDPGFGFGKTLEHNFRLLDNLSEFRKLGCPVMAGVSRKSMINKVLGTHPSKALNGTTVLHTIALLNGADIIRAHDVKEAVEAVKLVQQLKSIQEL